MIKGLEKKKNNNPDYILLIAVVLLAIIGTVFIYSASNYSAKATYKDEWYFVKKQSIGIALGIVAMTVTSFYDYKKLKKLVIPFVVITFILLILVFIPGIGVEMYGARR